MIKWIICINLVIETIELIDEELDMLNEMRDKYSCQISSIEPYIELWHNGYWNDMVIFVILKIKDF